MAVQEVQIKESIRRIVSQLQLMTYAAESKRPDVILDSIALIEIVLEQIKTAV